MNDLVLAPEVAEALAAGNPVVALESTIIAHGLPRPENLKVAREIEATVRAAGAVPATIAVLGGRVHVGLDNGQLTRLAEADGVAKLSARDLAVAAAKGVDGATTVAATSAVAAAAGIRVFATGGLGGVHRDAPYDESADLVTLARTPIAVVCAGVKSILDVGATLERLETLGVAVAGYRTLRFPGFYLTDSGFPVDWSLDSPEEAARAVTARAAQGVHKGALVLANPLPVDEQLDPALHDRTLVEGLAALEEQGVTGKAVTPFLLGWFHEHTGGASLEVNVRIILRNADLAARIAAAAA
ncbi:pseudouridine-5'-phosphate glycosidase [Asanoa ishikariensis]|uniref:Pseudouridine-5'-phosphate glycosidase n=1 Tax=Asanoa ishikariensis TaxID=137265 RepID=A0A1H3RQW6_9ACTN|nr:pseudouridine-5'-phosphate glycosidase [Asanoa ishikariensis]SDZ28086.1 pseudouridine-5'-phosphate glycosidase [Asanoa ishikariensis]